MVRADIFIQVLWQFLSVRRSRHFTYKGAVLDDETTQSTELTPLSKTFGL